MVNASTRSKRRVLVTVSLTLLLLFYYSPELGQAAAGAIRTVVPYLTEIMALLHVDYFDIRTPDQPQYICQGSSSGHFYDSQPGGGTAGSITVYDNTRKFTVGTFSNGASATLSYCESYTLTANVPSTYAFSSWSVAGGAAVTCGTCNPTGGGPGTSNGWSITQNDGYCETITLTGQGGGEFSWQNSPYNIPSGSAESVLCNTQYETGFQPNPGYSFTSWTLPSGANFASGYNQNSNPMQWTTSGTSGPFTLTANTCTVTYTTQISGSGSITISGNGVNYNNEPSGQILPLGCNAGYQITGNPNVGYYFSSWSLSGSGGSLSSTTSNPSTLTTGKSSGTLTASFPCSTDYPISISVPLLSGSYEATSAIGLTYGQAELNLRGITSSNGAGVMQNSYNGCTSKSRVSIALNLNNVQPSNGGGEPNIDYGCIWTGNDNCSQQDANVFTFPNNMSNFYNANLTEDVNFQVTSGATSYSQSVNYFVVITQLQSEGSVTLADYSIQIRLYNYPAGTGSSCGAFNTITTLAKLNGSSITMYWQEQLQTPGECGTSDNMVYLYPLYPSTGGFAHADFQFNLGILLKNLLSVPIPTSYYMHFVKFGTEISANNGALQNYNLTYWSYDWYGNSGTITIV